MSDFTIKTLDEVPDVMGGKYPGAMRFMGESLEAEQVAFTHRHMPPGAGGKGSYGHSHKTQEEIYFVVSGTLQFKLGDEVFEAGPGTAVRIAPETIRSVHNDGPDDVELIMCSVRVEDLRADADTHPDFWPQ